MSREKDQLRNTQDAGYMTDSGNHAAGGMANDTTQVNKEPNKDPNYGVSRQSSGAGSEGGDMTEQSIGGQGAQDGISGTPSGTQGGQSGQGINQGGQSQQSAQGRSDYLGGSPGGRQGAQLDPQEPNRDQYGRQQTGATSGEVGDRGGNQQSAGAKGGPGQNGLAQMKEQQQQGGPGNEQSQPRAGTGHGHGGQHSGGMGGERGGALHDVGAQSGQTGRGGLGGNNVDMQGSSKGNQQSGPNLIGQQTQGSGGSTSADRDSLDALPVDAMGGERVGMGSRGSSQQSDKAGNAQAETWSNQARPNNRTDNEQADRQLGMQGSPGEPGHDIDDLGSKQSGGQGSRGGSDEDQR